MRKYRVLRPIEHNSTRYVGAGSEEGKSATSAGHGGPIPLNASGVIELSESEAAQFTEGQIEPLKNVSGVNRPIEHN